MKPLGAPRSWPPGLDQELAQLLSERMFRDLRRRWEGRAPSLRIALDELNTWLDDPRDFDPGTHKAAWKSMVQDVQRALSTRGRDLQALTPALDDLHHEVVTPLLGADTAARQRCSDLAERGREQLAHPDAGVAAFDDLYDAIRSPVTSDELVTERVQVLDDVLHCAGRSLASEASALAGVMDNAASDIDWVRHLLDGSPLEDGRVDFAADAGLPVGERLELCRRLLRRVDNPGHHIVWLSYERATCRGEWMLPIGVVTFFDGPSLGSALEYVIREPEAASRNLYFRQPLPVELLPGNDSWASGWFDRNRPPEDVKEWVAVRVDLGTGAYADPVALAKRQADALVQLAGFHSRGTSWRRMGGAVHLINGVPRRAGRFTPPIDHGTWIDRTDSTLQALGPDLAAHLPVDEARMAELLEAAAVVQAHSDEKADPTTLLNDVRVIELLASRCSQNWMSHLKMTFASQWAKAQVLDEIYGAVAGLMDNWELRDISAMPDPGDLLEDVAGGRDRVWVRYDVALAALPSLAQQLPPHVTGARRVRMVTSRTSSPRRLRRWVNELTSEYFRRVERLARCRNSLAHGGPVNLEVAGSVKGFASSQAGHTTSLGLWAVIRGQEVRDAHDRHRAMNEAWRQDLNRATTVLDALDLPDRFPTGTPKEADS